MIRGDNLLLETPDSRNKFSIWSKGEQVSVALMIYKNWSKGDLSTCFLPFMCDVKAASSILATLISLEQ